MKRAFDPYRKWLGIPAKDQPPNHYRLLNIEALESDPDVIANAVDARMAHIKQYQSGKHSDASQNILNEIAQAKVCLFDPEKKAEYDEQLRKELSSKGKRPTAPPKAVPVPPPAREESSDVLDESAIPSFESPSILAHASRRSNRDRKPQPAIIVVSIAVAAVLLISLGLFFMTRKDNAVAQPAPRQPALAQPTAPADTGDATSDTGGNTSGGSTAESDTTDPDNSGTDPEEVEDGSTGNDFDPAESDPSFENLMGKGASDGPNETETPGQGDAESLMPKLLAVPAPSVQQKIQREIREIFEDDFAAARSPQQKVVLARKLYDQAVASADEPDTRFVLLRTACDLASEAGDVLGAMQVINTMGQDYEIKPLSVRVYVLKQATESMPSGQQGQMAAQQIVMAAIGLAEEHVARDEYDTASGFAGLALEAAKKSKNTNMIQPVTTRHREINRMKVRFASIRKARDALSVNPDDPAANLTTGRWHCFARGEWDKGLPLLAKGSDVELAAIAEQETAGPADPAAQMAVGDAWWKLADNADDDVKPAALARAKHWYKQALPGLEGLAKVKVKKRLETLAEAAQVAAADEGKEPRRPKGPKVRGVVQRGNVALATNGTTLSGISSGAHELIDGNSTRYTMSSGYAYGRWPCEWTITFDKVYNLNAIGIKLWDGEADRFYRYAVAISADGRNYRPLKNCSQGTWRSWQRIRIPNQPVKSVKLFGLYNSENSQFHVVEFEAYCVIPR